MPSLSRDAALQFREELRAAREAVLQDAEQFVAVIQVVERLGSYLDRVPGEGRDPGLAVYGLRIARFIVLSPLAAGNTPWLSDFFTLYDAVRNARNDAIHQGAYARHLATNTVSLATILEDALIYVADSGGLMQDRIDIYMIKNPTLAHLWQPIGFIRQSMLENSFSYLPMFDRKSGSWSLVSDYEIAKFLNSKNRRDRLLMSLGDAMNCNDGPNLIPTKHYHADVSKSTVLRNCAGYPVLIVHKSDDSLPLGIVTPFDLI